MSAAFMLLLLFAFSSAFMATLSTHWVMTISAIAIGMALMLVILRSDKAK